jgi:hypothetical protein
MSEENKMIYCTQCGSENNAGSKFCHNCGNKLEKAAEAANEEQKTATAMEGVFSGQDTKPAYEKITDAEEEAPAPIPSYREEIKINYSQEPQNSGNEYQNFGTNSSTNAYNVSSQPQYYSTDGNAAGAEVKGGGNIGFAIASMICGIFSIVCCCFTLFSAVLAVAAVVLGIVTLCFKYDGKGMAIAGIATGGVGLVIVIFSMVLSGTAAYNELMYDFMDDLYY